MKEGHEGEDTAIEARDDAAEMFEFVEGALDAIAGFVEIIVERDGPLRVRFEAMGTCMPAWENQSAQGMAVVAFVRDHAAGNHALKQSRGSLDVGGLTRGDQDQACGRPSASAKR